MKTTLTICVITFTTISLQHTERHIPLDNVFDAHTNVYFDVCTYVCICVCVCVCVSVTRGEFFESLIRMGLSVAPAISAPMSLQLVLNQIIGLAETLLDSDGHDPSTLDAVRKVQKKNRKALKQLFNSIAATDVNENDLNSEPLMSQKEFSIILSVWMTHTHTSLHILT